MHTRKIEPNQRDTAPISRSHRTGTSANMPPIWDLLGLSRMMAELMNCDAKYLATVFAVVIGVGQPQELFAQNPERRPVIAELEVVEAFPQKNTAVLFDPLTQYRLELRLGDFIGFYAVTEIAQNTVTLVHEKTKERLLLRPRSETVRQQPTISPPLARPAPPSPTRAPITPPEPRPPSRRTKLKPQNPYPDAKVVPEEKTGKLITAPELPKKRTERHRVKKQVLDDALSDFHELGKTIQVAKREGNIEILQVKQDSIPHELGLRKGDRILRVAGVDLGKPDAAVDVYVAVTSTNQFAIVLMRGAQQVTLRYRVIK